MVETCYGGARDDREREAIGRSHGNDANRLNQRPLAPRAFTAAQLSPGPNGLKSEKPCLGFSSLKCKTANLLPAEFQFSSSVSH